MLLKALTHTFVCFLFYAMTGLWGLVNNAGILETLPIEWTPLNTFKRIADVNLWGMIDVTKAFLPLVKKARGRVVNFSSGTGKYRIKKENYVSFLFDILEVSIFLHGFEVFGYSKPSGLRTCWQKFAI